MKDNRVVIELNGFTQLGCCCGTNRREEIDLQGFIDVQSSPLFRVN